MKPVLVTGSAGFLGSHLTELLLRKTIPFVPCDRKKGVEVASMLRDVRQPTYDAVIHLAAETQVGWCWKYPRETLDNNVQSWRQAYEIARRSGCPIIVSTTDKVYRSQAIPSTEETPLGAFCPYSLSKVQIEFEITELRRAAEIPIVVLRFGNLIGDDDPNEARLFARIKQKLQNNTPLPFADVFCSRQWVDVDDAAQGIMLVLRRVLSGEKLRPAYNMAGADLITVGDILQQFGLSFMGVARKAEYPEEQVLKVDSTLAVKELGWERKPVRDVIANLRCTWTGKGGF